MNPPGGGVNTPNFPENCMKSKEFGCPGGGVRPSRPPPRSANGVEPLLVIRFRFDYTDKVGFTLRRKT